MSAEVELLLCCARTQPDPQVQARIQALLRDRIDWYLLSQAAGSHGVLPLLYRNLEAFGKDAIPEAVLTQLRHFFRTHAQRNLVLTQELLRLLLLFAENGVPVIPIKGPVLTALIYGNLALRSFGDLDLLVHQEDALGASALLVSQGYRPQPMLENAEQKAYVRSHRALNFSRDDGQAHVDLQWRLGAHWQIHSSFQLDLERLWARLEPFELAGTVVQAPAPEDLLLTLCLHGTCHGWTELKLVCDIAELLRCRPELDWEQVVAQAKALGVLRILYLGLRLAHDLLDAELPSALESIVFADRAVKELVVLVRDRLFGPERAPVHLFEEAGFHVRTRERPWDRFRYALFYLWAYLKQGVIPTAEDRAAVSLPKPLTFLHYLIKPVRMIASYGLRPLKRSLQSFGKQLGR